MANKNMFGSKSAKKNKATAKNNAGGKAYRFDDKHVVAQMAVTGTFADNYYTSAEDQYKSLVKYLNKVDADFIAKTAVYARKHGYMKDMPAFLLVYLSSMDNTSNLIHKIFPLVVDNGRMLRNVVQIARSGMAGRTSLGQLLKGLICNWLNSRDMDRLFYDSVGNDPSMADVIKMAHPHPNTEARSALFKYLICREVVSKAPSVVRQYEKYKKNPNVDNFPNKTLPFQMLALENADESVWMKIAETANYHTVRMNLNTFARHGVLDSKEHVKIIADKLADKELVSRSRVYPYQLLAAYMFAENMPAAIKKALCEAVEHATYNVPEIIGDTYICVDTSGSMSSPATGYRPGATSKMNCLDIAAMFASAIMRKNNDAKLVLFDTDARGFDINPFDSVLTNARLISQTLGGGTDLSSAFDYIYKSAKEIPDNIVVVSDNESWLDGSGWRNITAAKSILNKIRGKNPGTKTVCIDICCNDTTHINDGKNVMNIGGFSDKVFDIASMFLNDSNMTFVKEIEKIEF